MTNFLLSIFFVFTLNAFAKNEIVLTVPVETNVGVAGLRDTSEVWLELIRGARKSIHLEHFYLSDEPNEALTPILDALRTAAGKKVEVKLILDSKFYETYPEPANSLDKLDYFTLKVVNFEKLTGGIQHAKFMIVDGEKYYLGSANMDWRALKHIHETGVAGDERAVADRLEAIFAHDWDGTWLDITSSQGPLQVVGSPETLLTSDVPYSLKAILSQLEKAKHIQLAVYELSTKVFGSEHETWTVLFDALKAAAGRGAKIEILLDAGKLQPEHKALVASGDVTLKAIKFPIFSGGEIPFARVLHSKFLILDGKTAWVGTDNWAKSYFVNSRGVGVIFRDKGLVEKVKEIFAKLWGSEYTANAAF